MKEPLLGRYEAAALLAVEAANGGELAPLEQFLAAYSSAFGVVPPAGNLADSLELLVDAGLVEWRDQSLGLTVAGRKTLRRAGPGWQQDRPEKLTERLGLIDEEGLAPQAEPPSPSEDELAAAITDRGEWQPDPSLGAGLQPVINDPIVGVLWQGGPFIPPRDRS